MWFRNRSRRPPKQRIARELRLVKTSFCPTLTSSFQPGFRLTISGTFVNDNSELVCIRNRCLLNLFCCLTFTLREKEIIGSSQFTISVSAKSFSGMSVGFSYYAARVRKKQEGALTQQMSFFNSAATGQTKADLIAEITRFHFDRCSWKDVSERFYLVVDIFTNFDQRPGEHHRLFARTETEAFSVKDNDIEASRRRTKAD